MRIALVSTAQRSGCPPIGLVYLASYIRAYTPHKVDIIDANYQDIFKVDYSVYDLIGISAMTVNYTKAMSLSNYIRQVFFKSVVLEECIYLPVLKILNLFLIVL